VLGARHRLCPFPEMLGAEQLSPDRPRQQVLAGVGARAPEAGKEATGLK